MKPATPISPSEYEARIRQLENLNRTLAGEIDRQRPVVEAAQKWGHGGAMDLPELATALLAYEAIHESSGGKDGADDQSSI